MFKSSAKLRIGVRLMGENTMHRNAKFKCFILQSDQPRTKKRQCFIIILMAQGINIIIKGYIVMCGYYIHYSTTIKLVVVIQPY